MEVWKEPLKHGVEGCRQDSVGDGGGRRDGLLDVVRTALSWGVLKAGSLFCLIGVRLFTSCMALSMNLVNRSPRTLQSGCETKPPPPRLKILSSCLPGHLHCTSKPLVPRHLLLFSEHQPLHPLVRHPGLGDDLLLDIEEHNVVLIRSIISFPPTSSLSRKIHSVRIIICSGLSFHSHWFSTRLGFLMGRYLHWPHSALVHLTWVQAVLIFSRVGELSSPPPLPSSHHHPSSSPVFCGDFPQPAVT